MSVPLATLHPYTFAFDARVEGIMDDGGIVLDKTYFYAVGGGQPADTGVLVKGDEEYLVVDVCKRDGRIVHVVGGEHDLVQGDRVACRIDEVRRRRLMRMHTAMHVLCAVIEKAEDTRITGNQIGTDESRLDVNLDEYDQEKIKSYVDDANRIIGGGFPVGKRVTSRAELEESPEMVKLAAGFPAHIQEVHLVEIEGVDVQPCGGTHVDNTAEIGRIEFVKAKNKGANNRRIYFTLADN